MNLLHKISQAPVTRPLISSHTILLLCGVLFGLCISEGSTLEIRYLFFWAGVIGLISFIGLRSVDEAKSREQLREAIEQTEQRLSRHAAVDPTVGQR